MLYAELHELEAHVAEAQAQRRPRERVFKKRAAEARARATQSANAIGTFRRPASESHFQPTDILKQLYREIARQIHPDLATDDEGRLRRTRFMADATMPTRRETRRDCERYLMIGAAARK